LIDVEPVITYSSNINGFVSLDTGDADDADGTRFTQIKDIKILIFYLR